MLIGDDAENSGGERVYSTLTLCMTYGDCLSAFESNWDI